MAIRKVRSPGYNYNFDTRTGLHLRWGHTKDHDPQWSPLGPEIADIEITTGYCSMNCPWCYKANTPEAGHNMTLETFRRVMDAMPSNLTQVALGITDTDANPDFPAILTECRLRGVVPNYTTSGPGMTDEIVWLSGRLCGAVAVSVYPHNWNLAWETVDRLIAAGVTQVNIHALVARSTIDHVMTIFKEAPNHPKLNAVVMLGLKPSGRGVNMHPASYEEFAALVDEAQGIGVPFGFDSCSSPKFERWAAERGRTELVPMSERCESGLFSVYVDAHARVWPCSFAENMPGVECITDLSNFWNDPIMERWRFELLANDRKCPLHNLEG